MTKVKYDLHLKGCVGGEDFDSASVESVLAKQEGKPVNVLIDSLGGYLHKGLSISDAFRRHGQVSVHFVGLNASAATIASLGAAHISIDVGAMYLVHKCSMSFFEWGSLNSDQFATLVADIEKVRKDLDKMDATVANLYAKKCKKDTTAMLALMKEGGWLTAQEALEWGFVDEITDYEEDPAARMTDELASAMAGVGMPIPHLPIAESEKGGRFAKFLEALTSFFKSSVPTNSINKVMKKKFQLICAQLAIEAIALTEGKASLSDEQLEAIEAALKAKEDEVSNLNQEIAGLKAKLDAKPAADTKTVVEEGKEKKETNAMEDYQQCVANAAAMFNALP